MRYRESQPVPLWIWLIMTPIVLFGWFGFVWQIVMGKPFGSNPGPNWVMLVIWLLFGIVLPILLVITQLRVRVEGEEVVIRWFPYWTRRVSAAEILCCEARRFRPIRDHGGWGIRYAGGVWGWVYTIGGDQGVVVDLEGDRRVTIGSRTPKRLAMAIDAMKK